MGKEEGGMDVGEWGMARFFLCVINHGMAAGSCLGGSGCDFASMTLLVGRLFLYAIPYGLRSLYSLGWNIAYTLYY